MLLEGGGAAGWSKENIHINTRVHAHLHTHTHTPTTSYACSYLFGGGGWALVSHVVGCGPQVHHLGRDAPLPRRRGLRCLDDVNGLGGDGLLFVFELFPRLAVVRRATPVLLVVATETETAR